MTCGRWLVGLSALLLCAGCSTFEDLDVPFFSDGAPSFFGDGNRDEAAGLEAVDGPELQQAAILGELLLGGYAGRRFGEQQGEPVDVTSGANASSRPAQYEAVARAFDDSTTRDARRAELLDAWMSSRVGAQVVDEQGLRRAQTLLEARGLYEGEIDGLMGPQTRAAVEAYEEQEGLPPTGRVTPGLLERLEEARAGGNGGGGAT